MFIKEKPLAICLRDPREKGWGIWKLINVSYDIVTVPINFPSSSSLRVDVCYHIVQCSEQWDSNPTVTSLTCHIYMFLYNTSLLFLFLILGRFSFRKNEKKNLCLKTCRLQLRCSELHRDRGGFDRGREKIQTRGKKSQSKTLQTDTLTWVKTCINGVSDWGWKGGQTGVYRKENLI